MPDIIRLYYKCQKCGKQDSLPFCPGFDSEPAYNTCPYCNAPLTFEPNCYTCADFAQDEYICRVECHNGSAYRQMIPKERR